MKDVQLKIQALKKARSLLVRYYERYICIALEEVRIQNPELYFSCLYLERYIAQELGGDNSSTLKCWQKENNIVTSDIRKDRIAYIDWMIQCYKEQGYRG